MTAQHASPGCGHGEEGRGLYSEGGGRVPSPPPPQNGEGTDLASVLTAFGVFVLAPAKLRATAAQLAGAGIDAAAVRDLAAFIGQTEEDEGKRRKYLAAVLSDLGRTKEALSGLAEHRRAAKPVEPKNPVPHMVNLPLGTSSCPCAACESARGKAVPEPWDHDRQCRIAWCLVSGDRKPLQQVAELMGVSESTLGVMLDRGRSLSEPAKVSRPRLSPKQARTESKDEQERREQFARQMRERKAVAQ